MKNYSNVQQTSEVAATRTQALQMRNRVVIYNFLLDQGEHGATDQEVETMTGIPGNSERPARLQMVKAAKVVDSGRTRPTRAGLPAIVWVAC